MGNAIRVEAVRRGFFQRLSRSQMLHRLHACPQVELCAGYAVGGKYGQGSVAMPADTAPDPDRIVRLVKRTPESTPMADDGAFPTTGTYTTPSRPVVVLSFRFSVSQVVSLNRSSLDTQQIFNS